MLVCFVILGSTGSNHSLYEPLNGAEVDNGGCAIATESRVIVGRIDIDITADCGLRDLP